MDSSKVIQDPVHGNIIVDGIFLDTMDRPEMQRLRSIKQLGLGYLVFPGANHTRFEHCLGAYHLPDAWHRRSDWAGRIRTLSGWPDCCMTYATLLSRIRWNP